MAISLPLLVNFGGQARKLIAILDSDAAYAVDAGKFF